jgi:hypothetical protein
MPEYFDISLIIRRDDDRTIKDYRRLLGLMEEFNFFPSFGSRFFLTTEMDDAGTGFFELSLGFPGYRFSPLHFIDELHSFTVFVNDCFGRCENICFALCSYELNGMLIGGIRRLENIDNDFLMRFPIAYKRMKGREQPELLINLDAQDLF